MMERRFYCATPVSGEFAFLEGAEAHHLTRVLRARPGDEVTLFDGSGAEFATRVVEVGKRQVQLEILRRDLIDRELLFELHVGVGLPKGDRQKWLVEKAVELGVTSLTPLETRRGVAEPGPAAVERLERYVIEASKQTGRNRLTRIGAPSGLAAFCEGPARSDERWFAHPTAPAISRADVARAGTVPVVWIAVGPEGGWTDDECELAAAAGWRGLSLGPRILRVETAVCFLASVTAICHLP